MGSRWGCKEYIDSQVGFGSVSYRWKVFVNLLSSLPLLLCHTGGGSFIESRLDFLELGYIILEFWIFLQRKKEIKTGKRINLIELVDMPMLISLLT